MMKILFVDPSQNFQTQWVHPLRSKGWGVVRARSVEDANRMMILHGDGLDAVVVHERFVGFAAKMDLPYAVLTEKWGESETLQNQNSQKPAVGFYKLKEGPEVFFETFESLLEGISLKSTGTHGTPLPTPVSRANERTSMRSLPVAPPVQNPEIDIPVPQTIVKELKPGAREALKEGAKSHTAAIKPPIKLQEITADLIRPEKTRTRTASLILENPKFTLGGHTALDAAPESESAPEITFSGSDDRTQMIAPAQELELSIPQVSEVGEISLSIPEETPVEQHTVILDRTQMGEIKIEEFSSLGPAVSLAVDEKGDESFDSNEPEFSLDSLEDDLGLGLTPKLEMPTQVELKPREILTKGSDTDSETLKNYLALREQDVSVLSGQLHSAKERVEQLEGLLKVERARSAELQQMVLKRDQQIKNYDQEKQVEHEVLEKQIEDLSHQLKERTDKARSIEAKLRLMSDEVNKLKERVRVDIRRIRVREKELENQLEVLKKDSSALLQARDEKIVELKRKLDHLEFNLELAQEQYQKEKSAAQDLKARLKDAASAMKQANGLLEQ